MLIGKNIYLDGLEKSDLESIRLYRNSPEVYNWFYEHEPTSSSQQEIWYNNLLNSKNEKTWAIRKSIRKTLIGLIGIYSIDWRNRHAEFGRFFLFPKESLGKGYGREALSLVIDYCFNHLNMHKLYCTAFSFNDVAVNLYESLGFIRNGVLKEHIYRSGKYEDLLLLELVR